MEKLAKENKPDEEEKPEKTTMPEDKCHDCSGKLILLADEKLQCEKCGLIQ